MQARTAVRAAARQRNKLAERAAADLAAALVTLDTARIAAVTAADNVGQILGARPTR